MPAVEEPLLPIVDDDDDQSNGDIFDAIGDKPSDAPLRVPKRLREGSRKGDMIARRLAAAHKVLEVKEGRPAHEMLLIDADGNLDPTYNDPSSSAILCVLNIGGSSYGSDFHLLEEWLEELEGFEDIVSKKGKAFSFLTFTKPEHAHEALQQLHTRTIGDSTRICLVQKARMVPLSPWDVTIEDPAEIIKLIPGLIIIPDFITEEEEAHLMEVLNKDESAWIKLAARKVQHHGVYFDYSTNLFGSETFDKFPSLPDWILPYVERLHNTHDEYRTSNQLTVNYYPPGSGIRPHVDTHSSFDGPVASLSLNAESVMEFRYLPPPPPEAIGGMNFDDKPGEEKPFWRSAEASAHLCQTFKMVNVHLPRRSLALMTGESRFGWEHSIRPRSSDVIGGRRVERGTRVSLTFRNVRLPPKLECPCPYWWLCDAKMPGGALPERFKQEKDRRKKWW
ncbi:hypothetical protein HDU97_003701 [Phlyctochytrium planicorne]|nr:hypothetical protein HDU97_003701 [Phlyctochytrium planicorne]